MEFTIKAFAKINVSLDVLSKMANGYHEIRSVMQSVDLCDEITLKLRSERGIRIETNLRYLPNDRRNLAFRAAELFFSETGLIDRGADIRIKKRIPVCAGLGGGSSDAAAVLRALNIMTEAGMDLQTLEKMGERLGSDVPFCVAGGTALAAGRGEILLDLPPLPDCRVLICKPGFSCSTPELFEKTDKKPPLRHPDTDGITEALRAGLIKDIAQRMYNVFEEALPRQAGAVSEIKSAMSDAGALGTVMSGTGPAVFGLFDDPAGAALAYERLNKIYRDCFSVIPVRKHL
ncbi:MAG: 4-(cytidine 5'-diphospho)-2-C-methyl-D-erythritol kinase [Oscillospiraceae bacterium]|nr:4-(cytidine 5'-diphospho)-2-C-methyl-D-erythritol kinase [Oscillospiraceae bacterium]